MTMDFATLKQDFDARRYSKFYILSRHLLVKIMEYNMWSHDDMQPERLSSGLRISESEVQAMVAGMSTNESNYTRCLNYWCK